MFRVTIKPQWQLDRGEGAAILPRLIELLVHVHESGTLAAACQRMNLSYRYAWGVLREGQRAFGVPLVSSVRGRGAVLSALGEKLVWADRRIAARLTPVFDSLASELEAEIERALSHAQGILRLHASHGFAVEALRHRFHEQQIPLDLKYCTSVEAVSALARGGCDMAGFHVPVGEFEKPSLAHYLRDLRGSDARLILLATRRLGLMTARGNPKQVRGWADLTRDEVRFVNRQPGAGTRLLIDLMLKQEKVDPRRIHGYDTHEFTHAAVAAYIASGMADAGFGVETPAQRFGLDFLPLISERYFFACRADALESPTMQPVLEELRSAEFRAVINALPGYDAMASGQVMSVSEAFGS
ncbi:MAG: substrate-binding domain-containing protein [Panacagrimonas sp.]